MNHVDLRPYPFPEGMAIPRLMPFQEYPWNGDGYLAAEVLRLKKAHRLTNAHETGTCLGSTTCWLAENFTFHVCSYEINAQYHAIAEQRLAMLKEVRPGVDLVLDKSENMLLLDMDGCADRCLVFCDAHWQEHCPLLEELDIIAKSGAKPCIVIHDFKVPGTDFGFDRFPPCEAFAMGQDFDMNAIGESLDAIYGKAQWKYNYPTKVEGARRGWISVEPIAQP